MIEISPKIVDDLSSIGLEINTYKTEVISHDAESSMFRSRTEGRKEGSDLLGSPLFEGEDCRILGDKTENLNLPTDRLMQIDRQTALFLLRHCLSVH